MVPQAPGLRAVPKCTDRHRGAHHHVVGRSPDVGLRKESALADAMSTLKEFLVRTWANRQGWRGYSQPEAVVEAPAKPQRFAVPREYLSLHRYLDNRFADTVVLTFAQIEDLLGFALPDLARVHREWWANPDQNTTPSAQARSWTQASRTAKPNLLAQTVLFERATG